MSGDVGRMALILLVCMAVCGAAAAQELPFPTVVCEGRASLDAVPDYVEFGLTLRVKRATLRESMNAASAFETKLKQALDTREIAFASLEVSPPRIPAADAPEVVVRATARFRAAPLREGETGLTAYAALCENMNAMAHDLKCAVTGPRTGVSDGASIVKAAVAKAVENAYPPAEGVAGVLRAEILSVERVEIEAVLWHDAPPGGEASKEAPLSSEKGPTDVFRIRCTAEVRVVYAFGTT